MEGDLEPPEPILESIVEDSVVEEIKSQFRDVSVSRYTPQAAVRVRSTPRSLIEPVQKAERSARKCEGR